jgi:serine/threonine-protein kinase
VSGTWHTRGPGQPPARLIRRILTEGASPIRRLAPEIPADLEAIVARCLEKNTGRRYASARALADNLQRFLDSDPVNARHLSVSYLHFRKARRHRVRPRTRCHMRRTPAVTAS